MPNKTTRLKTSKEIDDEGLRPDHVGVKLVPTNSLTANPHNPRMLFDAEPLKILQDSIKKVGILVPLTVYWSASRKNFVILDGQRRWICAQGVGLSKVPVNQVEEPTLVQNIVTMFQIHKLREDWELMPTALKLEILMEELQEKNEKKLSLLTGLEQSAVIRCKKLLSFPKKFQDLMLDVNPSKRVKTDFFIELHSVINDRLVKKMRWFSKDRFISRMLEKYESRSGLKSVTDFRIVKQHISNARKAHKEQAIEKRLQEFTFNDDLTLEHLLIDEADISASVRKLLLSIYKIEDAISDLDVTQYYGEEDLWATLERLNKLIRQKLLDAGRRTQR